MSWSGISKFIENKVLKEIGKQLNVEITKDGKIDFKAVKTCKFCKTTIPQTEIFCPRCHRALE